MGRKRTWIGIIVLIIIIFILGWLAFHKSKKNEQTATRAAPIPKDSTGILWYKNAVIYTLDVETFQDSDQDGVGDFKGLTQRLGYIDSLGATVLWLQPFQPSPNKDDGYDVADYYGIDMRYGKVEDFKTFMVEASKHHIKVIMDLVINHTSIEHPWFTEARKNPASPYRSWYVWSKKKPENYNVGMVFPGVQKEIWTFDSVGAEYYYHRFYDFQPDLNTENPAVETEIKHIIKYWTDLGLSGFRLDAVPFVIETVQQKGDKWDHRFDMLTRMRAYLQSLNRNAIILGEANVLPEETEPYFGKKADGIQMMFNFFVNQHLFYALATGDTDPLKKALEETSNIPLASQWGQFLRNHDEVDLGRLTSKQRNRVYEKFGPEKNMQLYDRGIRRRLPPMLNNNRKLLELANSALFSLPSTPVVRYGDELGMGDDLSLKERESVRTPMQWTAEKNGGFTSSSYPVKPPVDTGVFSFKTINVATEERQSNSFLNWTKKIIELRKECPEIGFGKREILETGNAHILAIRYMWQGKQLLVVQNFSDKEDEFTFKQIYPGTIALRCLLPASEKLQVENDKVKIKLPGYGYKWFRME